MSYRDILKKGDNSLFSKYSSVFFSIIVAIDNTILKKKLTLLK